MERAAIAGKLTREVVGRILTGKLMTLAKALTPYREWMKSRGRSPKTIEENTVTLTAWMCETQIESFPPTAITGHFRKSASFIRVVGSNKKPP